MPDVLINNPRIERFCDIEIGAAFFWADEVLDPAPIPVSGPWLKTGDDAFAIFFEQYLPVGVRTQTQTANPQQPVIRLE